MRFLTRKYGLSPDRPDARSLRFPGCTTAFIRRPPPPLETETPPAVPAPPRE